MFAVVRPGWCQLELELALASVDNYSATKVFTIANTTSPTAVCTVIDLDLTEQLHDSHREDLGKRQRSLLDAV